MKLKRTIEVEVEVNEALVVEYERKLQELPPEPPKPPDFLQLSDEESYAEFEKRCQERRPEPPPISVEEEIAIRRQFKLIPNRLLWGEERRHLVVSLSLHDWMWALSDEDDDFIATMVEFMSACLRHELITELKEFALEWKKEPDYRRIVLEKKRDACITATKVLKGIIKTNFGLDY